MAAPKTVAEKKEISVIKTNDKIASLTGFPAESVAIAKATVAKGTTDTELAFFLSIASSVHLNPLNKEIWCYKDSKQNLIVFAGRDGFLKRAQESPLWNGMTSFEVCQNDEFELDVTNAKVRHIPNFKNRGPIIGAYAIIKPKGCDLPTVEWADFKTYNRGFSVWKSDPAAMIKKVAEAHALKKAFGITVLQSEYDYAIRDDVAQPIDHVEKTPLQIATRKVVDGLDAYKGDDKEALRSICAEKQATGELTMDILKDVASKIGVAI